LATVANRGVMRIGGRGLGRPDLQQPEQVRLVSTAALRHWFPPRC
jgi:hypothetical protein